MRTVSPRGRAGACRASAQSAIRAANDSRIVACGRYRFVPKFGRLLEPIVWWGVVREDPGWT